MILYAAELPATRAELAKTKSKGVMSEVLENILMQKSRKELLPAVIRLSKDLNEEAKPKMHQEVIDETEVQRYLKEGWHFVSTFNASHAIVEIEEEKLKKSSSSSGP